MKTYKTWTHHHGIIMRCPLVRFALAHHIVTTLLWYTFKVICRIEVEKCPFCCIHLHGWKSDLCEKVVNWHVSVESESADCGMFLLPSTSGNSSSLSPHPWISDRILRLRWHGESIWNISISRYEKEFGQPCNQRWCNSNNQVGAGQQARKGLEPPGSPSL